MTRIHYSDNIHARGRELYLQTQNLDEGKIVSTLFDGGRVLAKEAVHYDPGIAEDDLKSRAEKCHAQTRSDIELLYAISSRVKTVRHPPSMMRMGRQFLRWNLLDEAISELELALQYDSQLGDAYLALGEAYIKRGGHKEAVQVLENGVRVKPDYADMWQKLGKARLASGQYPKAEKAFREALQINPSYDDAHFALAFCYLEVIAKRWQEEKRSDKIVSLQKVREHLGRATALSSRYQTPDVENAMRQIHQKEIEKALKAIREIDAGLKQRIDLDFDDAFYLGLMYGEKGKDSEAVQEYVNKLETMAREYPDYPDIPNKLGVAYLIQCRHLFNKALHQFRRASELNPDFEKAKNNLKLARNDGKGLLILLRAMLK